MRILAVAAVIGALLGGCGGGEQEEGWEQEYKIRIGTELRAALISDTAAEQVAFCRMVRSSTDDEIIDFLFIIRNPGDGPSLTDKILLDAGFEPTVERVERAAELIPDIFRDEC